MKQENINNIGVLLSIIFIMISLYNMNYILALIFIIFMILFFLGE